MDFILLWSRYGHSHERGIQSFMWYYHSAAGVRQYSVGVIDGWETNNLARLISYENMHLVTLSSDRSVSPDRRANRTDLYHFHVCHSINQ
jgi:hypothetical protein